MSERTAEQKIADMRRVNEFLKDEAIVTCLANMKWKCYDDFLRADSNEQRIVAVAQAKNMEEFATQLQIVRDRGEVELERIAAAEKRKQKS